CGRERHCHDHHDYDAKRLSGAKLSQGRRRGRGARRGWRALGRRQAHLGSSMDAGHDEPRCEGICRDWPMTRELLAPELAPQEGVTALLLDALQKLANTGEVDAACRIAGKACVLLRP